jgi:hypothetical protein
MEARRNLAVCDDGPRPPGDDRFSTMQTGSRRPIDEPIRDPAIDATALSLKDRDDLGFCTPDEIDEVRRRVVAGRYQPVAGSI